MKTIKQISDEIGVSKQAVQKRISREPLYTCLYPCIYTENGIKYIDESGENLIKSAFDKSVSIDKQVNVHIDVADNQPTTSDNQITTIISMLQHELEIKNKQIYELNAELAKEREHSRKQADQITDLADKLAVLTDNAQKLHLGTMHSNKQLSGMALEYTEDQPTATEEPQNLSFWNKLWQRFQ